MDARSAQGLIAAAAKQQELQQKQDAAAVSFFIRGKWPTNGNTKRLDGRKGPLGYCSAEFEDSVLCIFKANEIISYAAKFLPEVHMVDGVFLGVKDASL